MLKSTDITCKYTTRPQNDGPLSLNVVDAINIAETLLHYKLSSAISRTLVILHSHIMKRNPGTIKQYCASVMCDGECLMGQF